ncbi:putative oxidoreductase domain protein [Neisseria meningitidis 992008]|nr:putative oxidoreductase domain protein [Neisseria meningitidis 992008]
MDGWYDFRFQNVVYAPDRSPEISRMLSSILAGYAWDTENPFVAKSEQRLSALSEWVGQLETESILPYKMPSESNRVQTAFLFQLFL